MSIWFQSRFGRRVELVYPTVRQVDLIEMSGSLAQNNRYNGAAHPNVSVALHSLIADDIAAAMFPRARPWAILHDYHEERVSDITTPIAQALAAVAEEKTFGGADIVRHAIKELKRRHDIVIWEAAGIDSPTEEVVADIKMIDRIALKVERKYHMAEPECPWSTDGDGTPDFKGYFPGKYPETPGLVALALRRRLVQVLAAHRAERELALAA